MSFARFFYGKYDGRLWMSIKLKTTTFVVAVVVALSGWFWFLAWCVTKLIRIL
jgi:hypothetical protein